MKTFKGLLESRKMAIERAPDFDGDVLSNREMVREISNFRGRGIEVPVLIPGDVVYLLVVKGDLVKNLKSRSPESMCPWKIVSDKGGYLTLDINEQ
jgi:hypothetical protein|tara:strand:+ start:1190 stop:1477 length:288 start_codon:yes stop_codon:yes gene_type:complete